VKNKLDYERIRTFIKGFIKDDDSSLGELYRDAVARDIPVIREDAADYLKVLLTQLKPKRILEVGTAIGYSALYMADVMGGDTYIDTIEFDEARTDEAEDNFKRFGREDIIKLHRGDAAEVLAGFVNNDLNSLPYDLVFIDAAKAQYSIYLSYVMKLIHPGTVIVTDNIFESGLVLESHFLVEKRDRTIHDKMREYIYQIKNDERLETAILSVGDGIAVSVVKEI
jgi:Predicted O-methyltransferase